MFTRFKHCIRGNVAFMFAFFTPIVIGGAALGIDVDFWRSDQVRMQQATEAAAHAGALAWHVVLKD